MGSKFPTTNLHARARHWAERMKATPKVVRVQVMKNKWGSCSRRGVVTLAVDLARQPETEQDAVIVHELLHLKIRNHGRVFKALMTAYVPAWKTLRLAKCHFDRGQQG